MKKNNKKTSILLFSKDSELFVEIQTILKKITDIQMIEEFSNDLNPDISLIDVDTVGISLLSKLKDRSFVIILTRENLKSILTAPYIIAVGTTALRTLESTYWYGVQLLLSSKTDFHIDKLVPYTYQNCNLPSVQQAIKKVLNHMHDSSLDSIKGDTEIFIMPGYEFKICQGLITNFHQPGSTLILLVAAFIGDDWQEIYKNALSNNYRFLSYGDSTVLLK